MKLPIQNSENETLTILGFLFVPASLQMIDIDFSLYLGRKEQSTTGNPIAELQTPSLEISKYNDMEYANRILVITNQLIQLVRKTSKQEFTIKYLLYQERWDYKVIAQAFFIPDPCSIPDRTGNA